MQVQIFKNSYPYHWTLGNKKSMFPKKFGNLLTRTFWRKHFDKNLLTKTFWRKPWQKCFWRIKFWSKSYFAEQKHWPKEPSVDFTIAICVIIGKYFLDKLTRQLRTAENMFHPCGHHRAGILQLRFSSFHFFLRTTADYFIFSNIF